MYEAAFGLVKRPFEMTPDPASLFLTPAHREALAGLAYGVLRKKGFIVLIGDAGTGKTTLLRKLLLTLPKQVESSIIMNPTLTPSEFLELALEDFRIGAGAVTKAQRLTRMRDFLFETHRQDKVAVLIVDEAHKLSAEVLEEIRLLTNFETDQHKLLQIVLAGQTELRDVLNRQDLRQLKQRIAVRLEIGPLASGELRQYLQFRWNVSGGAQPLPFSDEAIAAIASWSRRVPRLVNALCDSALLLACGDGVQVIGASHINEVARDLDLQASEDEIEVAACALPSTPQVATVDWPAASPEPLHAMQALVGGLPADLPPVAMRSAAVAPMSGEGSAVATAVSTVLQQAAEPVKRTSVAKIAEAEKPQPEKAVVSIETARQDSVATEEIELEGLPMFERYAREQERSFLGRLAARFGL